MKKSSFWFMPFILLMAVIFFSGCSKEVNSTIDDDNAPADARGSLISFKLDASDYDSSSPTRAANTNSDERVVSSSTEKLGNGLEARVQVVESSATRPATRATTSNAPAGKYTILAYKDGVQKAKWVLNYNGSTYTMAEGNAEQYLPAGTYKFYAFNDKVSFADGKIVKSLTNASENALYFEGDLPIPNTKKHTLSFTLKPVFAKLYFKIKAFSNAAFNYDMSGTFNYAAATLPATETVDPTSGTTTTAKNTAAGSVPVTNFTANVGSSDGKSSSIVTQTANYFFPGTDITKLNFKFNSTAGGTIYGKAVKGKTLNITNSVPNLEAGKIYTVFVTIYYSADYLFSDGTVGTLMSYPTKTPVALVVDKTSKLAISTTNIPEYAWALTLGRKNGTTYSYDANGLKKAKQDNDGYSETYAVSGNVYPNNKTVKGESSQFPAFYNVAQKAAISGKKWYMPSVADWDTTLKYFGIQDAISNYRMYNTPTHSWGGNLGYQLVEILFYQVNGDDFDTWYWTANAFLPGNKTAITITLSKNGVNFGGATKTNRTYSRPFIKY